MGIASSSQQYGPSDRQSEFANWETLSMFDKYFLGFKVEMSSAFMFFENGLYKSVIVETILMFLCIIPYILLIILGTVLVCVGYVVPVDNVPYLSFVGYFILLLAFLSLFLIFFLTPFLIDVFNRVSEKTEQLLNGENPNPASYPRISGGCITFSLLYILTGMLESLLILPMTFCVVISAMFIIGIPFLFLWNSFLRSWGSMKVVFLRKNNYFGLYAFYFNMNHLPLLLGIGSGYICMKRVLKQFPGGGLLSHFVTVVSCTRFYHYVNHEGQAILGGENNNQPPQQQNNNIYNQQQNNNIYNQKQNNNGYNQQQNFYPQPVNTQQGNFKY